MNKIQKEETFKDETPKENLKKNKIEKDKAFSNPRTENSNRIISPTVNI